MTWPKLNNFFKVEIFLIGNLESIHFINRVSVIQKICPNLNFSIINTNSTRLLFRFNFYLSGFILMLKALILPGKTKIVFHGCYNHFLWFIFFISNPVTISIIQGSELNVDFTGIRAHIIKSILTHSVFVVCRNQAQIEQAISLTGVSSKNCFIVNWGLSQELFDIPTRNSFKVPVIISPRATQEIYNIPIIFNVIKRLKDEGHRLRFVYVRFNPTFELSNTDVADEILDSLSQQVLWEKMAAADLCISVPDYDALSNTVMEALALGSLPVVTNLLSYDFLKKDARLAINVEFGASLSQNAEHLYMAIKKALNDLEVIQGGIEFRRKFAQDYLKASKGINSIIEVLSDC